MIEIFDFEFLSEILILGFPVFHGHLSGPTTYTKFTLIMYFGCPFIYTSTMTLKTHSYFHRIPENISLTISIQCVKIDFENLYDLVCSPFPNNVSFACFMTYNITVFSNFQMTYLILAQFAPNIYILA